MIRASFVLIVLCILLITLVEASPPSFCKCTCFKNSTIIPLSSHGEIKSPTQFGVRAASAGCAQCNIKFCLDQRLPICKDDAGRDAMPKDVFTTCFQRDSRKDQVVVLTFIIATVGLLGWAFVRKVIEKRKTDAIRIEQTAGYAAVGGR